jgi:hypothetical protein
MHVEISYDLPSRSFFLSSGLIPSAALGEGAAISFNGIMIRTLPEMPAAAKISPCEALGKSTDAIAMETQATPPPLWTVDQWMNLLDARA